LADLAVIKFSDYLKSIDVILFNNKLSSFFFHKDGNWVLLRNYFFVDNTTRHRFDKLVLSELDNYLGVAQIMYIWFF